MNECTLCNYCTKLHQKSLDANEVTNIGKISKYTERQLASKREKIILQTKDYLIQRGLKLKIHTLSMSTHDRHPYAGGSNFDVIIILQYKIQDGTLQCRLPHVDKFLENQTIKLPIFFLSL